MHYKCNLCYYGTMSAKTRRKRKHGTHLKTDAQLEPVLDRIIADARNHESYPYWLPYEGRLQHVINPGTKSSPYPRLRRLMELGHLTRKSRGIYVIHQPPLTDR